MVFDMAMGVRIGDESFRRELDAIVEAHRADIDDVLRRFGVPRVSPDGR